MIGKGGMYLPVVTWGHAPQFEKRWFKFNHWVPPELTAEGKSKRRVICLALLRDQRTENIRHKIVTAMKNGCTTTIQAIKDGSQDPGNQQVWMTATAGSDGVQSGRPIFDDFFQHLWPYIGHNTANVVFQMVKR
ncbi:nephrin [Trichonephila clavipes]|nr:nephrin [Trichonephila clavipes]